MGSLQHGRSLSILCEPHHLPSQVDFQAVMNNIMQTFVGSTTWEDDRQILCLPCGGWVTQYRLFGQYLAIPPRLPTMSNSNRLGPSHTHTGRISILLSILSNGFMFVMAAVDIMTTMLSATSPANSRTETTLSPPLPKEKEKSIAQTYVDEILRCYDVLSKATCLGPSPIVNEAFTSLVSLSILILNESTTNEVWRFDAFSLYPHDEILTLHRFWMILSWSISPQSCGRYVLLEKDYWNRSGHRELHIQRLEVGDSRRQDDSR